MRLTNTTALILAAAASLMLAGCGGGGGSGPGADAAETAGKLGLIDISVADFDGVALNEIIRIEFSEELQPDSVRPDTIQIREGPNFGKQVFGSFRVDGATVFFYPDLPTTSRLLQPGEVLYAGLKPATTYQVTLPGAPKVAVVRSYVDDPLRKTYQERFETADADSSTLYIDNFLDPLPAMVRFSNPADGAVDVPADNPIILTFNRRPLDPATVTQSNVRLRMISRFGAPRNRVVTGTPVLDQAFDRVTITFRPDFPLADNAVYELVAERLEDLVGSDVDYFEATFSVRDEPFRYSTLSLEFNNSDIGLRDEDLTTASWNGTVADALAALFTAAGGTGLGGDLILEPGENIQINPDTPNADIQRGYQAVYEDGTWYDEYHFRRVQIPDTSSIRFGRPASGTNRPVRVLGLFPMRIDGTITVSGGNGEGSETYYANSPLPLERGGDGGPGGGNGANSFTGTSPDKYGIPMNGADGGSTGGAYIGGRGGKGGNRYNSSYATSGGGGGGGGANQAGTNGASGDSYYRATGGAGGAAETGNLERLPCVGGGGGGAGGIGYYSTGYYRTSAGAGGGAGGGLVLQGSANIVIGSTGTLDAHGGTGGDRRCWYHYHGGAGGGGAGGSIRLATTASIIFETGATINVAGGNGGRYNAPGGSSYPGGNGGNGGDGFICLAIPDRDNIQNQNGANLTYTPPWIDDTFSPVAQNAAPSQGQTIWVNLGVIGPEMIEHIPGQDRDEQLLNDDMVIEVQMCIEDQNNLGFPDLSALDLNDDAGPIPGATDDSTNEAIMSQWVPIADMHLLNGNQYQFIRIRVLFLLTDGQKYSDGLPHLKRLDIHFRY